MISNLFLHFLTLKIQLESEWHDFFEIFPRHPVVRRGQQQFWEHEIGNEWLVANPIDVPGLGLRNLPQQLRKETTYDYKTRKRFRMMLMSAPSLSSIRTRTMTMGTTVHLHRVRTRLTHS